MKRSKWIIGLSLLIITLGLLVGCQNREPNEEVDPPPVEEEQEPSDEEVIEETPEEEPPQDETGISVGNQAPNFTLENHEHTEVSLEAYEGKPVIISFWVSWNEDSLKQLQVIENINALLHEEVTFIGVHASAFDSLSMDAVIEMIGQEEYSYEVLIDPDSLVQQLYYVGNFPTTFVLDSEGRVTHSYTSLVEEDQLLEELEIMLEENQS